MEKIAESEIRVGMQVTKKIASYLRLKLDKLARTYTHTHIHTQNNRCLSPTEPNILPCDAGMDHGAAVVDVEPSYLLPLEPDRCCGGNGPRQMQGIWEEPRERLP